MRTLFVDIETFSSVSLPDCGVYKYAESPDFDILLLGYAFDDDPVEVIDLTNPLMCIPEDLRSAFYDEQVVKVAHNSQFERVCLSRYLGKQIAPGAFEDSMVMASWCGLPLSLGTVPRRVFRRSREKRSAQRGMCRAGMLPGTETNGRRVT